MGLPCRAVGKALREYAVNAEKGLSPRTVLFACPDLPDPLAIRRDLVYNGDRKIRERTVHDMKREDITLPSSEYVFTHLTPNITKPFISPVEPTSPLPFEKDNSTLSAG